MRCPSLAAGRANAIHDQRHCGIATWAIFGVEDGSWEIWNHSSPETQSRAFGGGQVHGALRHEGKAPVTCALESRQRCGGLLEQPATAE